MRRLMLKDLAILKRQKVFVVLFFFLFPSLVSNPLAMIAWSVFPILVLIQSLESIDTNGQESRLLRSLPLDASTIVGARYLFIAAVMAVFLAVVFLVRTGIKALGAPIPALDAGTATLSVTATLAYFALRNPFFYLLGPVKARWANAVFILILVAGGMTISFLTSPDQQRMPGMPAASLDTQAFVAFVSRPSVFLPALLAAATLYGLSFLLSCQFMKAKAD